MCHLILIRIRAAVPRVTILLLFYVEHLWPKLSFCSFVPQRRQFLPVELGIQPTVTSQYFEIEFEKSIKPVSLSKRICVVT